jgi:putative CocE/NonD family hydrolase
MGRNAWRDESDWPIKRAVQQRWYLCADGDLRFGRPERDAGEQHVEFDYDPLTPVPTLGGHALLTADFRPGPVDQRTMEARDDVIVFTSPALTDDLEVTGRVRATLHAGSSAPSTDWVVRLCDVHPDERSINICDGITRVAKDAQQCRPIGVDMWSTSNVFRRGHRLRVHVTSSSFPRWDRNLNTGDSRGSESVVARQTIYCDADRPSFIELPVVP